MSSSKFTTMVHGKWLLAGEHAVIRGNPALVFPILSKSLTLDHQYGETTLIDVAGEQPEAIRLLFWQVAEYAMQLLQKPSSALQGIFNITNLIPLGSGMGLSAALCAAMSQLAAWYQWIDKDEIFQWAKKLEHLFHGESSGVDIAGATSTHGMLYSQKSSFKPIEQYWQPQWYLSHTGQAGITSACVEKVKQLWISKPQEAIAIDASMADCVHMALAALKQSQASGLALLAKAINQAQQCFVRWDLVSEKAQTHMELLSAAGAIATKLTGSGYGGYAISLWDKSPPLALKPSLIAI